MTANIVWTPEQDARLIELFERGLTYGNIAVRLNRTKGSIEGRITKLRKMGHDIGRRPNPIPQPRRFEVTGRVAGVRVTHVIKALDEDRAVERFRKAYPKHEVASVWAYDLAVAA